MELAQRHVERKLVHAQIIVQQRLQVQRLLRSARGTAGIVVFRIGGFRVRGGPSPVEPGPPVPMMSRTKSVGLGGIAVLGVARLHRKHLFNVRVGNDLATQPSDNAENGSDAENIPSGPDPWPARLWGGGVKSTSPARGGRALGGPSNYSRHLRCPATRGTEGRARRVDNMV